MHQFWKSTGDKPSEISFETEQIELPPVREVKHWERELSIVERLRDSWRGRNPDLILDSRVLPPFFPLFLLIYSFILHFYLFVEFLLLPAYCRLERNDDSQN